MNTMTMTEQNTHYVAARAFDLSALAEQTSIMIERAATMHQRMMLSYDNPAAARTVDQAVLHVYEKGDTALQAAAMFDVDAKDVLTRKEFYDRVSDALGTSPSKLVVDHLTHSEQDDAMSGDAKFRRTPDRTFAAVN